MHLLKWTNNDLFVTVFTGFKIVNKKYCSLLGNVNMDSFNYVK